MTLDRGEMVEQETVLAHDASVEDVTVKATKEIAGKSPTQIAFQRLRKDKVAVVCTVAIVLLVLIAIVGPFIVRAMGLYWDISDPNAPTQSEVLAFDGYPKVGPPFNGFTWSHPLGVAPRVGYDNLAYLVNGLRTSLIVAVVGTVVSTIVGVVLGLMAGFSRNWGDRIISFFTDLFLAFPYLLGMLALAPIVVSRFKDQDQLAWAQLFALIIVLVVFGWMGLTRLIRGQVLSLREREFVLAAEAGLSFLGLGLTGRASLGKMVADATPFYADYGLYLWMPVGAITVLTLALNLLGDSVRDAFDPRTRR